MNTDLSTVFVFLLLNTLRKEDDSGEGRAEQPVAESMAVPTATPAAQ